MYAYVCVWDRQEGNAFDGGTLADYPVYRVQCTLLHHIRVLEREGTATPPVKGNLQPDLARNAKIFLMFLMRKDRDIQKLVDMLKMAACSGDKGLQKVRRTGKEECVKSVNLIVRELVKLSRTGKEE